MSDALWTAASIEALLLEAVETDRLLPRERGPKQYGNSMPEARWQWGDPVPPARWRRRATPQQVSRLMLALRCYALLPDDLTRRWLGGWIATKATKGASLADLADERGENPRTMRRLVVHHCQWLADHLNRDRSTLANDELAPVSENLACERPSTVGLRAPKPEPYRLPETSIPGRKRHDLSDPAVREASEAADKLKVAHSDDKRRPPGRKRRAA